MLGGLAEGKRDLIPGIGGALAVSVRRSAASSSGASEAKPQGLISSAAVSRTGSPVIGASSPPFRGAVPLLSDRAVGCALPKRALRA